MDDLISRQAAIDAFDVGAEFLRRVLDCTDIVGAEREKYEWGLGLIESYISDMKELPSADAVPVVRCKDCAHNNLPPTAGNAKCSIYYGMTDVYGFCHMGERRTDEID